MASRQQQKSGGAPLVSDTVETTAPTMTTIKQASAMLPDRELRPMNDLDIPVEQRLQFIRNVDVAPTLDMQDYLPRSVGHPVAFVRASGTKFDVGDEEAQTAGEWKVGSAVGTTRRNNAVLNRGITGWTDDAEDPVDLCGSIDILREAIGQDNYGDLTIQQLVRVHNTPDVLAACDSDPERVYEFLNSTADRPGSIAAKTGVRTHSTRSIAADELQSRGLYDPGDSEQRSWFSDKIQGVLSTVGVVTDTGETHFDMLDRGTLGNVVRAMRGDVLCRDTAIPTALGDGIVYRTERWNKRFFLG